jgi:hypothetical protein
MGWHRSVSLGDGESADDTQPCRKMAKFMREATNEPLEATIPEWGMRTEQLAKLAPLRVPMVLRVMGPRVIVWKVKEDWKTFPKPCKCRWLAREEYQVASPHVEALAAERRRRLQIARHVLRGISNGAFINVTPAQKGN